jgi:hypothetical protein
MRVLAFLVLPSIAHADRAGELATVRKRNYQASSVTAI